MSRVSVLRKAAIQIVTQVAATIIEDEESSSSSSSDNDDDMLLHILLLNDSNYTDGKFIIWHISTMFI